MGIIYGLDDVTLVPTPVIIGTYGKNGWTEWTESRQKALLYSARAEGSPRGRLATIWLSNVYGYVFREVGRIQRIEVREADPGMRHATTHQIQIEIIPPRQRRGQFYDRNFPTDCVLIAWGTWTEVDLQPAKGSALLWHDDDAFRRHWEDVRDTVNCAAESAVFVDTVSTVLDARPDAERAAERALRALF